MKTIQSLSVGELAKQAGVNVRTLHYYDKQGILKPAFRRKSGYRAYDRDAIHVLRFIKHAQALGFSLDEIQELLKLKAVSASKCEHVQKRAKAHLEGVKEKIARLERIRITLEEFIAQCKKRKAGRDWPILDVLERES
jgi:DNA-binding transcriptional MerR regulator